MMKRAIKALAVLGVCVGSIGAVRAQDIAIGAVLPLTGSSASIGEDQRRGMELAVERVNASGGVLGRKLKVITEDSGGRAPTALDGAKKLVTVNKVPVVLGEYSSGITIPTAQYLVNEGVSHVNIGSSSPKVRSIGEGSFSVIGLDDVSAKFAAQDVFDQKYRKAAFIAPNNAYGQGVAEEFKKNFEAMGGKVVGSVLYTAGQSTYRRELQQLERAAPDVYVYSAYGQEAAIINREAYDLALNKSAWYAIYQTMCTTDTPAQIANGQLGMEVSSTGPNGRQYEEAYTKRFGEKFKSAYSGYAYDGVILAAAAINKAGSTEPAKVRAALLETGRKFEGVTGAIAFDADRQRTVQPYVKTRYTNGVVPR
ncbi:ABC transporter substrate-binding protein [Thermomonas sp.]|uniref:ABC transporter substrate-binding protein n=1 Tax=Thermomonas sp. TaxID=1971895 RepID=UPI002489D494|nr:ABC transporter substrate-binding protein [Thermomonas sp.]MDI1251598.1 ABC transporter substrate-binding protein [Thermomonas sp.]